MGFKNLISFGADARIKKVQAEYEFDYKNYQEIHIQLERRKKEVDRFFLNEVYSAKANTQKVVSVISFLNDGLGVKDREGIIESFKIDKNKLVFIENSLKVGDIVIDSVKSVPLAMTLGAAAPGLAMWIAGTIGTASTGTAISALSGAAATNATLAWLGGGAIVAGGGGMAAGSALLSVLVPGVGVAVSILAMGIFSHLSANKKIKAIEEDRIKVIEEHSKIDKAIIEIDLCKTRGQELIDSLNKGCDAFKAIFYETKKDLLPLGMVSKISRSCKKLLGESNTFFSENEYEKIAMVTNAAFNLLKMRDSKLL